jgi:hypothetical protein
LKEKQKRDDCRSDEANTQNEFRIHNVFESIYQCIGKEQAQ